MHIIAKRTLRAFWERVPAAQAPLEAWFALVTKASWENPAQVRETFRAADFVGDSRVIFDIGGNKFRLVARIAYKHQRVMIKFVGTHKEYDAIDPETV
ncbi:type II toxin-antitoxin system HigB family toxin [Roseococcus sp.]|uniref:type II toxin-antitoxin system HigB family toxin n=1 Tax=Roseococcus sp. TaxID=2109646 RepID=UPI003BABFB59